MSSTSLNQSTSPIKLTRWPRTILWLPSSQLHLIKRHKARVKLLLEIQKWLAPRKSNLPRRSLLIAKKKSKRCFNLTQSNLNNHPKRKENRSQRSHLLQKSHINRKKVSCSLKFSNFNSNCLRPARKQTNWKLKMLSISNRYKN